MRIGDITTFQGKRWQVTGTKADHLCVLRAWDGSETEVPDSFEKDPESGLVVVAHPTAWPFIAAPIRGKAGPIVKVTFVREGRPRELEPLVDWAPSSMQRPGGPVFFNPELRLQRGEVLVAAYQSGKMARLMVNASFASVKRRQERVQQANQPPVRRTVYDRLMSDDDMFED